MVAVSRSTGIAYGLGGGGLYSYRVDVTDNGEPGSSPGAGPDSYAIRIATSSGTYYQVAGTWVAKAMRTTPSSMPRSPSSRPSALEYTPIRWRALTAFEASTKSDSSYKHADTISGIDPYYGAHAVDPSTNAFADEFVFVKGNDVFFVAVGSQKDDALSVASSQAKTQYDSAPAGTIPTADWPENTQHSAAYNLGGVDIIVYVVLVPSLFVVTMLAAYVPARRASRIAPTQALRYE